MSSFNNPANITPGLGWLLASPIGRVGREPYWLVLLLVWLPIYCVVAVTVMNALPRFR